MNQELTAGATNQEFAAFSCGYADCFCAATVLKRAYPNQLVPEICFRRDVSGYFGMERRAVTLLEMQVFLGINLGGICPGLARGQF